MNVLIFEWKNFGLDEIELAHGLESPFYIS